LPPTGVNSTNPFRDLPLTPADRERALRFQLIPGGPSSCTSSPSTPSKEESGAPSR
jgi:hypothetical protein